MSDDDFELEDDEEEDKTQEMIQALSHLSIEAKGQISDERANKLIQDLHEFMEAHVDEQHMLNFIEMIFIFARALRFSLIKVSSPCECSGCEHCHGTFDPSKETIH